MKVMKWMIITWLGLSFIGWSGCTSKGCMDVKASNFSYEAEQDDGSCEYLGCTDEEAVNYDKDARTNDGSCQYLGDLYFVSTNTLLNSSNTVISVTVNAEWIGYLQSACINQSIIDCETTCEMVPFINQPGNYYTVDYYLLRPVGTNLFDTIAPPKSLSVRVIGKQCRVINLI